MVKNRIVLGFETKTMSGSCVAIKNLLLYLSDNLKSARIVTAIQWETEGEEEYASEDEVKILRGQIEELEKKIRKNRQGITGMV